MTTITEQVYFTAAEVAARWRISTRTLATYVSTSLVPEPTRFNGRRLWSAEAVVEAERRLAARPGRRGFSAAKMSAVTDAALTCAADED